MAWIIELEFQFPNFYTYIKEFCSENDVSTQWWGGHSTDEFIKKYIHFCISSLGISFNDLINKLWWDYATKLQKKNKLMKRWVYE